MGMLIFIGIVAFVVIGGCAKGHQQHKAERAAIATARELKALRAALAAK